MPDDILALPVTRSSESTTSAVYDRLGGLERFHLTGIGIPNVKINYPDSKVRGANTGPIWGQQDPGGPHVGPMNFVIWVVSQPWQSYIYNDGLKTWEVFLLKGVQKSFPCPSLGVHFNQLHQIYFKEPYKM